MSTTRSMKRVLQCAAAFAIVAPLGSSAIAASPAEVPYSTPPGITVVDVANTAQKFAWRRIGDDKGAPLFALKADASGKVSCTDACAKEFAPFTAPASAVAYDVWTLVPSEGGAKQWAYQGRPLYRYIGSKAMSDMIVPEVAGKGVSAGISEKAAEINAQKTYWQAVEFHPEHGIAAPAGIKVQSLEVAAGYALVDADSGAVIYNLSGAPKNPQVWKPVYAPSVAVPVGDFSITKREDATLQWAYKGRPLYTYREDYSPSDVNGIFADSSAQVALAYRHFMPAAVQVVRPTARGPLMTTADGKTVYTEGQYHLQYGGRSTRDGYYLPYDNAKSVGTRGCVDDCLKMWRPVLAPADAQPRGLWEITTRSDGTRQWVYKGAALYTYAADKKLGDINGNNRHVAVYGDPQGKIDITAAAGEGTTTTGYDRGFGSGFYWHTVMLYTQMPAENPPPAGAN